MVQRTTQTVPALTVAAVVLAIAAIPVTLTDWALSVRSGLYTRLTFHFFHASIFHALINCWCLLSVSIIYKVRSTRLIPAFIIAALAPDFTIAGHCCVVGLSAVCFALIGIVLIENKCSLKSYFCVLFFIALGVPFPSVCVALHLYAFLCGILFGLIFLYPCIKYGSSDS
ncbi:MAG: rhomboid family intramembrane serine protease [Bacteroidales bacterium]|nr:rhomboid family intramembrane serine protease [Bacteroidales bacterium]